MKVIIAGSRHMGKEYYDLMHKTIQESGWHVDEVVCGMAKGADLMGRDWAKEHGIPVVEFPADWERYGVAAGPIRNKQMADYADALIVFIWNGSRGSKNMLEQMDKLGKPSIAVYDGGIAVVGVN